MEIYIFGVSHFIHRNIYQTAKVFFAFTRRIVLPLPVAQRDLLGKLKENNVAKVSLLMLLTKENLFVCFH